MKFGFVIPVYNHGSTLEFVVSNLDKYNFPMIVVDDGNDLKNKESLERAKMRLDCLSVFDDFENFAFYYELLMSNEKEYVK